mmetsp:Transcript_30367/g.79644  ORF Transcript_30367/g.79644 Transcript_30367/m.79644 type:complete len:210 (-) Transcript_30367:53-682(-)
MAAARGRGRALLAAALCVALLGAPAWLQPGPGPQRAPARRAAVLGGALASLCAGPMAALAELGYGPRDILKDDPPAPDENPLIRAMQAKSWSLEPFVRLRIYLKAVSMRTESSFFAPRYFVHQTVGLDGEGAFSFDIMDENSIREARQAGHLLLDSDMSDPNSDQMIFAYGTPEDKKWCQKNVVIEDTIQVPDKLVASVEKIRNTPFGR